LNIIRNGRIPALDGVAVELFCGLDEDYHALYRGFASTCGWLLHNVLKKKYK
jgi:hypothetical protein